MLITKTKQKHNKAFCLVTVNIKIISEKKPLLLITESMFNGLHPSRLTHNSFTKSLVQNRGSDGMSLPSVTLKEKCQAGWGGVGP